MEDHNPDSHTWGQRHGLTVLGVIALVVFAVVILIQVS
jgi:hypothetical protein